MLFVFAPLQAAGITVAGITIFQVLGFASALVLIGGVFFVSASLIVAAAMVAALAMAVWAAFARLTAPSSFDVYLIAGAWLTMSVVLSFVVGRTVFAARRVREIDRDLLVWLRRNDVARRLTTIPGIGPIGATALAASVAEPH